VRNIPAFGQNDRPMMDSVRRLIRHGFKVELFGGSLTVRTQSGTGRVYEASDKGAAEALAAYESQLVLCPECGGTLEVAHRAGDGYAPECSYDYCLDCGWQGEPE